MSITFEKPTKSIIKDGNIIIKLEKMYLKFDSDLGKEEGNTMLTVGDKETTVYWSGNAKYGISYDYDTILFAGDIAKVGPINFLASVVESDEDDKYRWEKAASVLKSIGSVGSAFPVYGAPITAGFDLISRVAHFISTFMHNRHELNYNGSLNKSQSIAEGKYILTQKSNGGRHKIEIVVSVDRLEPASVFSDKDTVRVFIKNFVIPKKICDRIERNGLAILELNVGDKNFRREIYSNALKEDLFAVDGINIYEGSWRKEGLPVSCSFLYTRKDIAKSFTDILALYDGSTKFIRTLTPKTDKDDKVFDIVQTVSSSLLAGVTPSKEKILFSFNNTLIRQAHQALELQMHDEKGNSLGKIEAEVIVEKVEKKSEKKPHNPEGKLEVVVVNSKEFPALVKTV